MQKRKDLGRDNVVQGPEKQTEEYLLWYMRPRKYANSGARTRDSHLQKTLYYSLHYFKLMKNAPGVGSRDGQGTGPDGATSLIRNSICIPIPFRP